MKPIKSIRLSLLLYVVSVNAYGSQIEILLNIDNNICSSLINSKNIHIQPTWNDILHYPDNSEILLKQIWNKTAPLEWDNASVIGKVLYDADNDGEIDTVFIKINDSEAFRGTELFITPKSEGLNVAWSDVSLNGHYFGESYSIPYIWAAGLGGKDSLDDSIDFMIKKYGIRFRFRYLQIAPFIYNGTTYYFLSHHDQSIKNYGILIKPINISSYETMCIFKKNVN